MISDETRAFIRLSANVSSASLLDRYYWKNPIGDHTDNIILMVERWVCTGHDGEKPLYEWVVIYADKSLFGSAS